MSGEQTSANFRKLPSTFWSSLSILLPFYSALLQVYSISLLSSLRVLSFAPSHFSFDHYISLNLLWFPPRSLLVPSALLTLCSIFL